MYKIFLINLGANVRLRDKNCDNAVVKILVNRYKSQLKRWDTSVLVRDSVLLAITRY